MARRTKEPPSCIRKSNNAVTFVGLSGPPGHEHAESMKKNVTNNTRWFALIGVAALSLTLIGIAVTPARSAPEAISVIALVVDQQCMGGDNVQVTLSAVVDPDQQAKFRWDFNNDGVFDTQANTNPTVVNLYPDEETVTAAVAARNRAGETARDRISFGTLRCEN